MKRYIKYIILLCLLQFIAEVQAQNNYTLNDILEIAKTESWEADNSKAKAELVKEEWVSFKSQLKPKLSLNANLPGYYRSTSPVIQPNGTVNFQQIQQNSSNLSLVASQQIPLTGGFITLQSDITRFDDFTFNSKLYNGIPIRLGFQQEFFAFNSLKWDKKINKLKVEEAKANFNAEIEFSMLQSVNLFFNVLIAKENVKIAKKNAEQNEKLFTISSERLRLGKISKDENIQMNMELENALLNLNQSSYQINAAEEDLWTYIANGPQGLNNSQLNNYEIPEIPNEIIIDENTAVEYARKNRPELIQFQRQRLEADRNLTKAKRDLGPQANFFASFGFARGSESIKDIYTEPFSEQQVSLNISLPIFDGGNKKSAIRQAEIQKENMEREIKYTLNNQEKAVRLKVRAFHLMQKNIKDQKRIKTMAEQRFTIANERYLLSAMSITEWSIAQRARDNSQRNYIQTLGDYWRTYYELRLLTGYDFLKTSRINY